MSTRTETLADAQRCGFRPCKRCKPDQPSLPAQQAAMVAQLCRHIESAEQPPSLDALAAQARLSPHHLHRVFKAITGVTPKAYASAHRARRLRETLGRSDSVTEAIYDAGYNSAGRFYTQADQVLGMTPTRFRAGGSGAEIRFAIGQCSLGAILVARSQRGVCAIELGDDPAARIDAPQSARAVAQACGANPLAVAIPCHRVVRSDGGLSGYRWGVERKRALLASEAQT